MVPGTSGSDGLDSLGVPTDPLVYIVDRLVEQYPGGVPYDRVIQMADVELCMQRSTTVRELEALVDSGLLEKPSADRLTPG